MQESALFINRGFPVRLAGGRYPLAARVAQQYAIAEQSSVSRAERWQLQIAGYSYIVETSPAELELFAFHWHPHVAGTSFPHVHLGAGAGARPDLIGIHVPTARIALEDFARFLIEELHVRPRRADWVAVLARTRAATAAAPLDARPY